MDYSRNQDVRTSERIAVVIEWRFHGECRFEKETPFRMPGDKGRGVSPCVKVLRPGSDHAIFQTHSTSASGSPKLDSFIFEMKSTTITMKAFSERRRYMMIDRTLFLISIKHCSSYWVEDSSSLGLCCTSILIELAMGSFAEKLVVLDQLAMDNGLAQLVREYPSDFTRALVEKYGPAGALRKFLRMRDTFDELRRMEKMADQAVLLAEFEMGLSCVCGRDRLGRPIVWLTSRTDTRMMEPPFVEILLVDIWIVLWAMRLRTHPDHGIVIVSNDFGRQTLDFNVKYISKLWGLISGLMPVIRDEHHFFLPNTELRVIGNHVTRAFLYLQGQEGNLSFSDHREDILPFLEHPAEYPSSFLKGGKPFEMSYELLGNWRDLVFRHCGIQDMTLSDIYYPDSNQIEEMRNKSLIEDTKLRLTANEGSASLSFYFPGSLESESEDDHEIISPKAEREAILQGSGFPSMNEVWS